ncbi:putative hydroxyproline-rich glyco protein [Phaeoacremonium minimum UCRPA7]|uniref:Putative hydroxyproline-rich glyco protein n=1 Tax=Phaeoacremonium minimum (strain UCR-PA7) TaxID=1286976 RepID=R8BAE6_PHAM7|nr:putative hydroxyproline-rich glyco protein [Phaeoacremonium minimum UCRPA7]EON96290.1 putative hydroxyproline-rich glyco protein [Phaeoacremonium minimum UCRPA7]
MEDSAAPGDGDATEGPSKDSIKVIDVAAPKGDAVLDVTFETSKETLRATRKATQPRPGQRTAPPRPLLQSTIRRAYRVDVAILKKQSKYFDNLLGDTRFEEARTVIDGLKALSLRNEKPGELDASELPWVKIIDDDEATRSAGREAVFADLLRILHGKETEVKPPTMLYVTNLAVLADQFLCTGPVSRYLNTGIKFKWPVTQARAPREGGLRINAATEEVIRQKILSSWLLDQPTKLHAATRELILYGSHQWSPYAEPDESRGATWWDLQDDLESKQVVTLLLKLHIDLPKESCSIGANVS